MENRTFTDAPGAASAVTMRRRVLFRLPPVPARESVELMLYDPDGTLVKRSRYRMMPIAVDATELPPGVYQVEFRWWNGKTNRLERVSVNL